MPPIAGTQPSIKWSFTIPYRGGTKSWSTKMHFTGDPPADNAHWAALHNAMWADFFPGLREDVRIVSVSGYAIDGAPTVYFQDLDAFGTLPKSDGDPQAAIIAALLSWPTDAKNSRGGPIFARNFVHGVVAPTTDFDQVVAAQVTALTTFAHKFSAAGAGYSDGTVVRHRCVPKGAVGLDGTAEQNSSRRVLARRG